MPSFTGDRRRAQDELRRHGGAQLLAHRDRPGLGTPRSARWPRSGCASRCTEIKVAVEKDTDHDPYDWQTVASKGTHPLRQRHRPGVRRPAGQGLRRRGPGAAGQRGRPRPRRRRGSSSSTTRRTRSPSPELAIGYAYPNGNAIGGPLVGRRSLRRAGAQQPGQGDRSGPARARLDLRRPRRRRRASTPRPASSRCCQISSVYDVGPGDQPRAGARAVHRRHGAGPRHRAVRGLHLRRDRAGCSTRRSPTTRSRRPRTCPASSRPPWWRPPRSTGRTARAAWASTR